MSSAEFALRLLTYCYLTSGSVTSWFRTAAHNLDVGGMPNSAHLYGVGADVVYDAPVPLAAATERAERLGLRLLREGDHDHLQPVAWHAG